MIDEIVMMRESDLVDERVLIARLFSWLLGSGLTSSYLAFSQYVRTFVKFHKFNRQELVVMQLVHGSSAVRKVSTIRSTSVQYNARSGL